MSKLPFEDIRVVDFSWAGTGAGIVKYLTSFGATVVKVESSQHLDVTRLSAPFKDGVPGVNRSLHFCWNLHLNKYGIALNMNKPKAREVCRRLIAWSDVVVENFAPGVMQKWGLDYDNLKRIRPDVIMLQASIFGQTGAYAKQPGFGYQVTGLAGFYSLVGWPDGPPLTLPMAYTDQVGPLFGAAALIAALEYRHRTGKGQCLDLAQIEASLHFQTPLLLDYVINGREPVRRGNADPGAVPHGAYRCKGDDRWCVISISKDCEWEAFVRAIGSPSLARDARFSTFKGRKENEDQLNKLIETVTINLAPEEIMHMLQSVGVPAGVVAASGDLLSDPQSKERGYYQEVIHPEIGPMLTGGLPFRLSKTPSVKRNAAPCLGEHSEWVCTHMLGMSDEEFLELDKEGIFE